VSVGICGFRKGAAMAYLLLRRLIPAVLLAATATISGSAIGRSPVAWAVPGEWDIGAYDDCVQTVDRLFAEGKLKGNQYEELMIHCCIGSGGVWQQAPGGGGKCVAPPANPARAPSNVPTHTLQPEQPPVMQNPGNITQTFAPGPAS
jgi:hypothetical protein